MNRNTLAWAAAHAPAGARWGKKALSLLLSLMLCLGLLPTAALAAEGDNNTNSDTPKAIQLGTGGLQSPKVETYSSPSKPSYYVPQSYVYFGADGGNPIKWRVLDANRANDDETDGIFLLSENTLLGATVHFNQAAKSGNSYQDSAAQQWCSEKVSAFSAAERDAMLGVTKTDDAATLFDLNWGESSLTKNDKLFFLSVQELYDHVGTATGSWMKVNSTYDNPAWWLRTPDGADNQMAGYVSRSGDVTSQSVAAAETEGRPAFNLSKDAVLMISVRYYKSNINVGQLTSVADAGNYDGTTDARDWKLTLKDNSRNDFDASVKEVSASALTVSYANAATGTNEYLSALVKGSDGTVKYYGRILALDADSKASGTADIPLPDDFNRVNDTLYVYSEQCNDGNNGAQTDYASELVELKLSDYAISADVTALDFGSVPTGFTAVPAAKPVTITNTGTKQITVNLPTSDNYTITADEGFTDDKATLAAGAAATFTVQPVAGRDSYADTLTVETNQSAQCEISLSYTRSDTQPTEYAQITLVNTNFDYGCQLLLSDSFFDIDEASENPLMPKDYNDTLYKLPENADPAADTQNVVSSGKSVSILITAGTYDYYVAAPAANDRKDNSSRVPAFGKNDVSFDAGKHYTITISAGGTVTQTEKTVLSIHTVTAYGLYGGAIGLNPDGSYTAKYAEGDPVSLRIGKRDGYTLESLTLDGITEDKLNWSAKGQEVNDRDISFAMPANDVTVTVNWKKNGSSGGSGSSGSTTYPVTVTGKTENGSVTVSPKNASKGTTVTVTVTPDKGYTLETLTVIDKNGNKLTLKDKGSGKYTFTQPGGKVTVTATFMDDNTMLNYFADVTAGDYFYDAVLWAAQKGITSGTDAAHFSPYAPCTRAQIVTFLWRAAGSPVVNYAMNMSDVPEDAYYAEAVRWALSEGITSGTSDTAFSPDAPCTRAQAVAFLFRCAAPDAVTLQELVSGFSDAASVPGYALPAMNWALAAGILQGSGQDLMPGSACTRAQIVTFLYRTYQGK